MPQPDVEKARNFIFCNARLLERHLFSFHFEGGPAEIVERALNAYRHQNGLFGFGLEPDKRASEPQPVDQAFAMEILDAIGASKSSFLSVCDALNELTNEDGGLPFSHPTVETAPHAPWWGCRETQSSSINPTGIILSFLWANGLSHPWMMRAEEFCWEALNGLEVTSFHSIQNGLTFLATHPDKQRAEAALSTFRDLVRASTCFDTDPEGYAFSPLIFAPSPNSPGASFFTHEEIQPHLQFMIDQQQDDGGWPINWPPISDGVHSECRGIVTLRNLNILKSYNSLG
ncbi:hypothetical protein [Rhodophyticola porphyridii]|uniref:hypothetical protein n=1 Tax=Rhodophyticola porphyridii TaxID=1852017 RepID=UPI0035D12FC2